MAQQIPHKQIYVLNNCFSKVNNNLNKDSYEKGSTALKTMVTKRGWGL